MYLGSVCILDTTSQIVGGQHREAVGTYIDLPRNEAEQVGGCPLRSSPQ